MYHADNLAKEISRIRASGRGALRSRRECICFFLPFGHPEWQTPVCQRWLTARGTIEADTCSLGEEVFSESAVGVRLRMVRPVDDEELFTIRCMEWEKQAGGQPRLRGRKAQALLCYIAINARNGAIATLANDVEQKPTAPGELLQMMLQKIRAIWSKDVRRTGSNNLGLQKLTPPGARPDD
jgi:hypothetical protein